jgi:hypothetical protein
MSSIMFYRAKFEITPQAPSLEGFQALLTAVSNAPNKEASETINTFLTVTRKTHATSAPLPAVTALEIETIPLAAKPLPSALCAQAITARSVREWSFQLCRNKYDECAFKPFNECKNAAKTSTGDKAKAEQFMKLQLKQPNNMLKDVTGDAVQKQMKL